MYLYMYIFATWRRAVVQQASQAPSESSSCVTNSRLCVFIYSSSELRVLNSFTVLLPSKVKAVLGRLRLLRTVCWGKRRRCSRRQKRGKRGGLLAAVQVVPSFKYPGLHRQLHLVCQHSQRGQEGPPTSLIAKEIKACWPWFLHPCCLLQMCRGECPDPGHYRIVWQLHCSGQKDIYVSRCRSRASNIIEDPTHPTHDLFTPLPSRRRLSSVKARTSRLRSSFFPEAVRLMNNT